MIAIPQLSKISGLIGEYRELDECREFFVIFPE
jgi:hypothetical protein